MTSLRSRIPTPITALFLALLLAFATAWAQEGGAPAQTEPAQTESAPADAPTPPATADEAPAADQAPAARTDDPIVIQVGSTVERLSDFERRFEIALRNIVAQQGLPYGPEVAQQLRPLLPTYLEQRAQEVALVAEARRRGFTPDEEQIDADIGQLRSNAASPEEFQQLLAGAGFHDEAQLRGMLIEADIVNQLIQELRAQAEAQVTAASLKARYLAERERFRQPESFCARHILVAEEGLAAELLERLEAGEEFADLAAEHGTDGTRTRGGDLGCFGRGMMVPDFEQAVLEAEVGVPAGPVETQFGYHVLLVYDRTAARLAPFEEVEAQVREFAVALATEAAIDGLIAGSGIVTYPENLE